MSAHKEQSVIIHPAGLTSCRLLPDFDSGPAPRLLRVSSSILDLTRDWVLFTYAPLFLFGHMRHNPVQEYVNISGAPRDTVALLSLDLPLLSGIPHPWSNLLWACRPSIWQGMLQHIASICILDMDAKAVTRVVYQEFKAPDIVARRAGKLQNFPLSAFGADCSHGYYLFLPPEDTISLPRLVNLGPEPGTIALASSLLNDKNTADDTCAALARNDGPTVITENT